MKVYQMNDCNWIYANSKYEAKKEYRKLCKLKGVRIIIDDNFHQLSDEELNTLSLYNTTVGKRMAFAEALALAKNQ